MERKLTGSLEIFGYLVMQIRSNFNFKQSSNNRPVPPNVLDEFESIKESKTKQLNEILEEPEIKQLREELNANGPNSSLPPQVLSRKITLSMSDEFFATWVEKAFDDLIKEKPFHKKSINVFYKENFGVNNKYN